MTDIAAVFRLPMFDDPDTQRSAWLLDRLIWLTAAVYTLIRIAGFVLQPATASRSVRTLVIIWGVSVLTFLLLRRRQVLLGSILFAAQFWVVIVIATVNGWGLRTPVLPGLIIVVLAAGLLIGWRAGLLASLVCILTVLAVAYAEAKQVLLVPPSGPALVNYLLANLQMASLIVMFVYFYKAQNAAALTAARRELAQRQQAEQALREGEEKFKYVFDHSVIGKSITFPDGRLTVNRAFCDMLGYAPGELNNELWQRITHPDDLALSENMVAQLLAGAIENARITKRYLHKSGAIVWAEVGVALRRNPQGQPLYFITSALDITQRKLAEEALRASEANYRRIIETAREGVLATDANWRVTFANDRMAEILGYAPAEMLGLPIEAFLLPDDLGAFAVRRAERERGIGGTRDGAYRTKSGTPVWLQISSAPTLENGRFAGTFFMATDITARKLAEDALRESEDRFRAAFQTGADAFVLVGQSNGRLYDVNEQFCRLYGYTRDEAIGRTSVELGLWADPVRRAQLMAELAGAERVIDFEVLARHRDGRIFPVLYSISKLHLANEALYLGVIHDITERKLAEEALRESEDRFRAAFQTGADGFVLVGQSNGRMYDANEQFCRLYGYTRDEVIGRTSTELGLWVDPERRVQMLAELAHRDRVSDIELLGRRKDGTLFPILYSVSKLRLANEDLYLGVVHDITERKLAEVAQRESEAQYRNLFDNMVNGMLVMEVILDEHGQPIDHRFVQGNSAFEQMTGAQSKDLVGKTSAELPFIWGAQELENLYQVAITGKPIKYERLSPALGRIHETRVFSPRPGQFAHVFHDITDRKQAEQQLLQLNRLYVILTRTNEALVRAADQQELFTEVCRIATADGWLRLAWVGLTDPATRLVQPVAAAGDEHGYLDNLRISRDDVPEGQGPTGTAIREDRHVICRDIEHDPVMAPWSASALARGFRASAAFPLRLDGQAIGALTVYAPEAGLFSESEVALLDDLAADISYALEALQHDQQRQRAETDLQRAYDETIVGWSRALDLRDRETEGHSQRVTELTMRMAAQLDLTPEALMNVRRGALLHDIGKMGVPDAVLRKPGPLDDDEQRVMRLHPQLAHDLLAPINYLQPALDIPYCHHEKWDGSGYPRGLRAADIPLAARIFALADVWDALTSDRPYRLAWSKEKALAYIRAESGRHFDPDLADLFLQMDLKLVT